MNSEENPLKYEQWLKKRQKSTNNNRVRATAFQDSALLGIEKDRWSWIRESFRELNFVYKALETTNYQQKERQENTLLIFKTILGLDEVASEEDVAKRAKEFGKFVDVLIEKGKQWRKEEKLMEKGR